MDRWDGGNDYDLFMGRWSRLIADEFVRELGAREGLRWLDVGCGTGALLDAALAAAGPSAAHGVDPSHEFVQACRDRLGSDAKIRVADGDQLPFDKASFDLVVSGLVLNFIPDPLAAIREWRRVTEPGGLISLYVWDYAGGMEFLRYFWDVAADLDPAAHALDEGVRFPICQPEPLADLFTEAGLSNVTTGAVEVATPFLSFGDYWAPFLRGQGPAPSYVSSLAPPQQEQLKSRLKDVIPTLRNGAVQLTARAWTATGVA
ncbi:MAG: class I SAM-dependent methyltransferase [Actinomycetota bacterium]